MQQDKGADSARTALQRDNEASPPERAARRVARETPVLEPFRKIPANSAAPVSHKKPAAAVGGRQRPNLRHAKDGR